MPSLALQVLLAEFYKGAPDLVKFQEAWSPEHTYLDKLKVRLWTPPSRPTAQVLWEAQITCQSLSNRLLHFPSFG